MAICAKCDRTLSRKNVIGLCRLHASTRKLSEYAPEVAERIQARGRELASTYFTTDEGRAKRFAPEVVGRSRITMSDTRLPWCPREWRPRYRLLAARFKDTKRARETVEIEMAQSKLHSIEGALAVLKPLAPTYGCDAAGKLNPRGTHWRHGSRVYDRGQLMWRAAEVIARAERRMGRAA